MLQTHAYSYTPYTCTLQTNECLHTHIHTHPCSHINAHACIHRLYNFFSLRCSRFRPLPLQSSFIMNIRPAIPVYTYIFFSITGNRGGLAVRVPECLLQGKVPKAGLWSYFCKNHLIPIFIYQPEDLAIYRVLSVQVAWISFPQGTVLQIIELQTPRRHTQRHRFP